MSGIPINSVARYGGFTRKELIIIIALRNLISSESI